MLAIVTENEKDDRGRVTESPVLVELFVRVSFHFRIATVMKSSSFCLHCRFVQLRAKAWNVVLSRRISCSYREALWSMRTFNSKPMCTLSMALSNLWRLISRFLDNSHNKQLDLETACRELISATTDFYTFILQHFLEVILTFWLLRRLMVFELSMQQENSSCQVCFSTLKKNYM